MKFLCVFFLLVFAALFAGASPTEQEQEAYQKLKDLFESAKNSFAARDFVASAIKFEQLTKLIPEWADGYLNWARAELEAGHGSKALEIYREGVKRFPESAVANLGFCQGLSEMLNRPSDYPNVKLPQLQEARNVCIKAVKLSPDDPQPLQTLAAALTLFMDYKAAIEAYESWLVRYGVSHTNQKKQVLKNLGAALIRSGNNERALEVANELMKLDPSPDNIGFVAHVRSIAIPMDTFAGKLKTKGLVREVEEYKLRSPLICKPGQKWRVALNYSEEAVLNSELIKVRQLNPDTAYQSYGRIDDPVFVGTSLPRQPHFYHERIINIIFLQEAFISGHSAVVHSNCAVFTGSHHAGIDLQTFSEDDNVPLKTIQHRTASIMGHQLMNYYHWIIESLPKLLILKEHILLNPDYKDVKILVPQPGFSSAIDDTLALPEFNAIRSRFIFYENPTRQRYHFPKGLILADWIHHSKDTHKTLHNNLWSVYWPPKQALQLIRDFFHTHLKSLASLKSSNGNIESTSGHKIVYISRAGKVRGFPNEKELIEYLQKRFGSLLKIHTGTEPLLIQVAMFYEALVVVGAHGAGLTNYVYTKLGAALVMIPMDPHVEFCFSHLVAALEGRHYIVSDIPGSHYYGSYGALSQAQMVLLGDTVQKALDNVANVSAERDEL